MGRRLLTILLVTLAALPLLAGPAGAAGGWATVKLERQPMPVAGEPEIVAFEVLSHGVTPVTAVGARIEVTDAGGVVARFPVRIEGKARHVAEVMIAEPGPSLWVIDHGWGSPVELGTIPVRQSTSAAAVAGHRLPPLARYGLPAMAALLLVGLVITRRPTAARRTTVMLP